MRQVRSLYLLIIPAALLIGVVFVPPTDVGLPAAAHSGIRCTGGDGVHGFCACYAPDTPDEYIQQFEERMIGLRGDPFRFSTDVRWTHTATDGDTSGTEPITLTYSFVPDYDTGAPDTSNVIHATLDAQFGTRQTWKDLFHQLFAGWSDVTGIRFVEVSDDGASWPDTAGQLGARGDIRLVAFDIDGAYGVLAYAYLPNTGDMALDKSENWADPAHGYRFLRNTLLHELGHAFGLLHVNPRDGTKLMEALLALGFDGPQDDDIRGADSFYGDAHEPNDTSGTASDLGAFSDGLTFTDLSLHTAADADWYVLSGAAGETLDVEAAPVGGTYLVGPDPGTPAQINTLAVHQLRVEVYDAAGQTLLGIGSAPNAGETARATGVAIPGGGGFRVRVTALDSAASVQRYSLALSRGTPVPRTLTLASTPYSGATIALDPAALSGATSAITPAGVSYNNGQSVTLTAPATLSDATFVRWQLDGNDKPFGTRTLAVLLDQNHAATAVFSTTLAVDAGLDQAISGGQSAQLGVTVLGGTPPYTYAWTPDTGLSSSTSASPIASPAATTTYTVTVTDAGGHSGADSVRVEVLPPLAVDAGPDLDVVTGRLFTLNAHATGGMPPYRFAWSPADALTDSSTPTTRALIDVATTFTVSVTDAAGATAHDEVVARIAAPLAVSAGAGRTIRPGQTALLTASVTGGVAPFTFMWTPLPAGTPADTVAVQIAPTRTTVYTVFVTDAIGQHDSASVQVIVAPPLQVTVMGTPPRVRAGESTTLAATVTGGVPPFTFDWTPADGLANATSSQTNATPGATTVYDVLVRDAAGQTASANVEITVEPRPTFTAPATFCGAGFFTLAPLTALSCWSLRRFLRCAARRDH